MEKKSKILIFAGTTEGRELAEFLSEREVEAEISVATEYGETLLSPGPFLKIHQGRMEEGEMEAFFREEEIGTVVDATHPYAVVVSENIREACTHTGTEYIRLLRLYFRGGHGGSRGVSETDGGQRASDDRKQGAESLHGSSGF